MSTEIGYLLIFVLFFCFLVFACIYLITMIYSLFNGAPYVATTNKDMTKIFHEAKLVKGETFLDLGCGDGRVLRYVVRNYGVQGIGIDINRILILLAKLKNKNDKLPLEYCAQSILDAPFERADVIYLYLFPLLITALEPHLTAPHLKVRLIISHGFRIPYLSHLLTRTLKGKTFNTYLYTINSNSQQNASFDKQ